MADASLSVALQPIAAARHPALPALALAASALERLPNIVVAADPKCGS